MKTIEEVASEVKKIRDLVASEKLTIGNALDKLGMPRSHYYGMLKRLKKDKKIILKNKVRTKRPNNLNATPRFNNQETEVNFCPKCGCNLKAIKIALSL